MKSSILLSFISIFLVSCAGLELTAQQCQSLNWESRGIQDGTKGEFRFSRYRNACSDSQFNVDSVHEAGYLKGFLSQYCKGEVAFRLGKELAEYDISRCDNKKEVLKYFTEGRKRGVLKKQIKDLDQKRRELVAELMRPDLSEEEINRANEQILRYEKEIRELEREFSKLTEDYLE
ncbi:DUF2799 domain-containing protein [Halobacteriovorax marinus]|uniref:DUF2799 domain-containing protein n=1 Tax=Halobacteriovorax marinus TaxID=97084 RepID=UPI003A8EE5D5